MKVLSLNPWRGFPRFNSHVTFSFVEEVTIDYGLEMRT